MTATDTAPAEREEHDGTPVTDEQLAAWRAAEESYEESRRALTAEVDRPGPFVPLDVPDPTPVQAAYLAVIEGLVPATAGQVSRALGMLGIRLQELTDQLAVADRESTRLAEEYELAYNRAYLVAGEDTEGRVTEAIRKAHAVVQTHQARLDMEVAKLAVRSFRQAIKTLDRRIDTGRTMAATVRAEARLTESGFGGGR